MTPLQRVASYLDEQRIPYETIHHKRDYTSQRTAADTHTPGKAFAKTVILNVDNRFCMLALPASFKIDLAKVKRELSAKEVRLATEGEFSGICTDCEVGAMPPFGRLYDLPVYVSHLLAEDHLITFNAGTHEDAIRMRFDDYEKLARPAKINCTIDR
jgi:Ala-tRNA(Pro) deacylase